MQKISEVLPLMAGPMGLVLMVALPLGALLMDISPLVAVPMGVLPTGSSLNEISTVVVPICMASAGEVFGR